MYYHLPPLTPNKLLLPSIMTNSTHTDCTICSAHAPRITLSPRHSLDTTIAVSGFANPVQNSPNLPLTQ